MASGLHGPAQMGLRKSDSILQTIMSTTNYAGAGGNTNRTKFTSRDITSKVPSTSGWLSPTDSLVE